tara:strand:+ start:4020 stop:4463 length:444 start_codon:yes stop_codon:yes gene_type:complete
LEYIVIVIALLVLVGSISIAIPSRSSREISNIRLEAKKMGFKITSNLYGKNKFKNKNSFSVSYQIKNLSNLKEGHFIRDKTNLILYSPIKLKFSDHYNDIKKEVDSFSDSIEEIIFTDSIILFLWKELDGLNELKSISKTIDNLKIF